MDQFIKNGIDFLTTYGGKIVIALLVLIIGCFVIKLLNRLIAKGIDKTKVDETVKVVSKKVIRVLLYVLLFIGVIEILGVPMSSVVAVLASCGLALGLALQGAVGNLLGGLILLILRPIRAGEYVKIGDSEGTVKTVGAYYTELITVDNKQLCLPNGALTNTTITNFSREGTRRLDLTFSVDYSSDLDQVYRVLNDLISKEEAILPDPAPQVVLSRCADSSLDFAVRVWVKTNDYWPVNFRLLDKGKRALDAAGITIPFPQMDVHVKS